MENLVPGLELIKNTLAPTQNGSFTVVPIACKCTDLNCEGFIAIRLLSHSHAGKTTKLHCRQISTRPLIQSNKFSNRQVNLESHKIFSSHQSQGKSWKRTFRTFWCNWPHFCFSETYTWSKYHKSNNIYDRPHFTPWPKYVFTWQGYCTHRKSSHLYFPSFLVASFGYILFYTLHFFFLFTSFYRFIQFYYFFITSGFASSL